MTPSADDILACETAHALFGDAVLDRRGLKRSYAALIKVYDPDGHPDVFRHIRDLYEAARRGDTGAPDPEPERPTLRLVTEDEAPEPSEPDAGPSVKLRSAMEEGDSDTALAVLETHDLELRIDHPGLWFASVAALADTRTFSLPADLLQSWLDAIDGAPEGIPDSVLSRIELLTSTGVAYRAARQDRGIDPNLLDLIAQWGKDPVTVAEAFLALGEEMPEPEAAWQAHQDLKERYPELWFPYMLMANQVTQEVDSFDESSAATLQADRDEAWRAAWCTTRRSLPPWMSMTALFAVWMAPLIALRWELADAGILMVSLLITVFIIKRARMGERHTPRTSYDEVSGNLLELARAQARFPHEALDLALLERSFNPPPTLLRWQQDPTLLPRILTPAHLDRVRREAQEAE